MCVHRNDGRWDASNAIFEKGLVTKMEKGREDAQAIGMAYIDYGLSVLTGDAALAHIPAGEPHDLAAAFGRLAEAGKLRGFEATERFYEIGFLNRITTAEELMPKAMEMAEHLLTLPPASRVNTVQMMREMRPRVAPDLESLADALHNHGAKSDRMESRAAFAEKRAPNFIGWDDPQDRFNPPRLEDQA